MSILIRPRASVLATAIAFGPSTGPSVAAARAAHADALGHALREHGGRVVRPLGAGFLIEFKEPVAAAACALGLIGAANAYNPQVSPGDATIDLRIGLHHGDVEGSGEALRGPGVSVARDLLALANPNTVCVSQVVLDQVKYKVSASGVNLGAHEFESLLAPLHAYVLVPADQTLERVADSLLMASEASPETSWPRFLPLIAVVVFAAAIAASFFWPSDPAPSTKPAHPAVEPATAPVATANRRGGKLVLGWQGDTGRFELYGGGDSVAQAALDLVLEPLVTIDAKGAVKPWVVARWTAADDGSQVSLQLRERVYFHPSPCLAGGAGRLATGADLAYSITVARDRGVIPVAVKVGTAPSGRVVVQYPGPTGRPMRILAPVVLIPTELKACEDLDNLRQPVGTGPFRFASTQRGDTLSLDRAFSWWRMAPDGMALPYLNAVELRRIISEDRARVGIESGQFQAVRLRPVAGRQALHVRAGAGVSGTIAAIVSIADASHRRAIGLAIDRKRLLAHAAPPIEAARRLWRGKAQDRDPDSARQLAKGLRRLRIAVSGPTAAVGAALASQMSDTLGVPSVQLVRPGADDQADIRLVELIARGGAGTPPSWLLRLARSTPGLAGRVGRLVRVAFAARGDASGPFEALENALTQGGNVVPLARWSSEHPVHDVLTAPGVRLVPEGEALRPTGMFVRALSTLTLPKPVAEASKSTP